MQYGVIQELLCEVKEKLRHQLDDVVSRINLQSPARREAAELLKKLCVAEQDLFSGFLRSASSIEVELRESSCVDATGRVNQDRMRKALSQARRMVGARTLIGDTAIRLAEGADLGVDTEPADPWQRLQRDAAPWEASFLSVLRVLQFEDRKTKALRKLKGAAGGLTVAEQARRLPTCSCIKVVIVGAYNLPGMTAYCTVEVEDRANSRRASPVAGNCDHPRWDLLLEFRDVDEKTNLVFIVWNKDRGFADTLIGSTKLSGAQIVVGFCGKLLLSDFGVESYLEVQAESVEIEKVEKSAKRQSLLRTARDVAQVLRPVIAMTTMSEIEED